MAMTKEQMHEALMRLGEILRDRQISGEIAVFGGAAMILCFEFQRATQDVDSLVTEGHGQVIDAAQQVERELHLPANWLNEQATIFLSQQKEFTFFRTFPSEGQFGLRVLMATPEYLLSMKLLAFRLPRDVPDISHLARLVNITTEEDLLALFKRYYPDESVSEERLLQIRALAKKLNETPNS